MIDQAANELINKRRKVYKQLSPQKNRLPMMLERYVLPAEKVAVAKQILQ